MTNHPSPSTPLIDPAAVSPHPAMPSSHRVRCPGENGSDCHRRVLITGITGQDGSYLAELLLNKGYEVHGLIRRSSTPNVSRIAHLLTAHGGAAHPVGGITLHYGDLNDGQGLATILSLVKPHEVYHLAAQSDVRLSFDQPLVTADIVGMGTLRMLEAVRRWRDYSAQSIRFYQASSSEMFGNAQTSLQDETTPFEPCSPYGIAKLFAHRCSISHREAYGLHVCSGILFNHESPRRGENFVTRKITLGAARIKRGLQDKLILGNLDARRDWGFTGDYVQAMWLIVQQGVPADYVIATGRSHSVRELCELAFTRVGLDYREFVTTDERLRRPNEIHLLCGDASKAAREMGWRPRTSFESMIHQMVDADLERVDRHLRADHAPIHSLMEDGTHVVA